MFCQSCCGRLRMLAVRSSCLGAILTLTVALPLAGQGSDAGLSVYGTMGWLQPTSSLAASNPDFANSTRRGSLDPGLMVGLGLHAELPNPLPQLRLSIHRLMGSDLVVEERGGGAPTLLGASLIAGLLEAVVAPVHFWGVAPHAALGLGFLRYDFAETSDLELARLFEDGQVSPAASLGLGATVAAGRFQILLEAGDLISTYDSPPVESTVTPGVFIDRDEVQHDLRFTAGLQYLVGGW